MSLNDDILIFGSPFTLFSFHVNMVMCAPSVTYMLLLQGVGQISPPSRVTVGSCVKARRSIGAGMKTETEAVKRTINNLHLPILGTNPSPEVILHTFRSTAAEKKLHCKPLANWLQAHLPNKTELQTHVNNADRQ